MSSLQRVRLLPGAIIDERYLIEGYIGEGGFAAVFKARHIHIGRAAALKILQPQHNTELKREFERRFLQEAQAMASLNHAHIVSIHDFGFHGVERVPYLAMELLQGHDLETELLRGPLSFVRAQRLILPVMEALQEAHRLKIVHKDLKPANLFLAQPNTEHEKLKVLDFGVARIENKDKNTKTGLILGTPQYLSPEYIEQQSATPAMDVYQLGLILVEMLTGSPVIAELNPLQCVALHIKGGLEIPEPLLLSPLGPILELALALEPEQRFHDAGAFGAALAQVVPHTVPPVEPTTPRIRLARGSGEWGRLSTPNQALPPSSLHTNPSSSNLSQERSDQEFNYQTPQSIKISAEHVSAETANHIVTNLHLRRSSSPQVESIQTEHQSTHNSKQARKKQNKGTDQRRLTGAIFISLVVLFVLTGFLVYFIKADRSIATKAQNTPTPKHIHTDPRLATPQKVTTTLISDPIGAKVYRDEQLLGTTPFSWSHLPEEGLHRFVLQLDQYEPQPVEVDLQVAGSWEINLRPQPQSPKHSSPTSPPPAPQATSVSSQTPPPTRPPSSAAPRTNKRIRKTVGIGHEL